jgi:hypothetical protein
MDRAVSRVSKLRAEIKIPILLAKNARRGCDTRSPEDPTLRLRAGFLAKTARSGAAHFILLLSPNYSGSIS